MRWPERTHVVESHLNSNKKTMKKLSHLCASKMRALSVGVAFLASLFSAQAAVDPMTVSAGDVTQTSAVLWAHSAVPGELGAGSQPLIVQVDDSLLPGELC